MIAARGFTSLADGQQGTFLRHDHCRDTEGMVTFRPTHKDILPPDGIRRVRGERFRLRHVARGPSMLAWILIAITNIGADVSYVSH